jgi:hypothetical protein
VITCELRPEGLTHQDKRLVAGSDPMNKQRYFRSISVKRVKAAVIKFKAGNRRKAMAIKKERQGKLDAIPKTY